MLKFLLIAAVVGGIIGLVFAKSGNEEKGFWSGAKSGLGCGCGCLVFILVIVLIAALIMSTDLIPGTEGLLEDFTDGLQSISSGIFHFVK